MICDPRMSSEGSAIYAQIEARAENAGVLELIEDGTVQAVAEAVEQFLVQAVDDDAVDSRTIDFLAAQALESLGDAASARRLLLYGTGMVRPSEWVVTGDQAIWVLDLKQMTLYGHAPLELLFFRSMLLILDAVADIWDECSGDGVLGLRHVCTAAAGLLGVSERADAVSDLAAEIVDACTSKLDQLREARGWLTSPSVMNLDL